eukprot:CAMPEP_0202871198 /NCGR_PEP_ID=MMETSP1391-20130828/18067_1 /ASSEMBLY_ACC=CAM_ASM_000867 /TAXON_ID=1034604 /ORGANISM="Chlamydomonas leiostraca, Strain SAG 11-49" /LENGTH=63 /DNA_ID=CAMNT_0049551929 /DNA_START=429 /DNA_END=617 /DNA_ORIENTATION=-
MITTPGRTTQDQQDHKPYTSIPSSPVPNARVNDSSKQQGMGAPIQRWASMRSQLRTKTNPAAA